MFPTNFRQQLVHWEPLQLQEQLVYSEDEP